MHLALHLAGVKAGDDVMTSAFACMSTNSAIAAIGARPVWVDMAAGCAFVDVDDFISAITPKTRAAILYHVAGYPGPAKEIAAVCQARGITLIEDCDNALLATFEGRMVGDFGDFAVYSFYPNRQINTTEGGALVCRSIEHANRARKLRRFGIDGATFRGATGEINPCSDIPEVGWSITMNNLCAALGAAQLDSVESRIDRTRANALFLKESLAEVVGVRFAEIFPGSNPAYWALLINVENRNAVLAKLKSAGVLASTLHQRNDIYTCFHASDRALPNTEIFQQTVIALPCGWWIDDSGLRQVVAAVVAAVSN